MGGAEKFAHGLQNLSYRIISSIQSMIYGKSLGKGLALHKYSMDVHSDYYVTALLVVFTESTTGYKVMVFPLPTPLFYSPVSPCSLFSSQLAFSQFLLHPSPSLPLGLCTSFPSPEMLFLPALVLSAQPLNTFTATCKDTSFRRPCWSRRGSPGLQSHNYVLSFFFFF